MAQPQTQANVHQDELCPPNKCYALMDANKKINLDNPLCPNESKIMANIFQNHPLRFSITSSSSVPWIYLGQRIFQLPQATDNNHERFVATPKFSEMAPFFLNDLGFTLELGSQSNLKTTGLVQPWQTFGKMIARCLTTRVTRLHYSLEHPSTLIPYPRFTKIIVSHYMTAYPKISRRVRDKYHNLEHDEMVKSIFNLGKNKAGVRIMIPNWMITDEMKLTENYRMYAKAFRVDVPTTQSQSIESTQRTHSKTSAPRSPNPDMDEGESSAPRKSTVIRLCIPLRRSTRLTTPTPIPTTTEAEEKILQDTIQLKGTVNVENIVVDSSTLRQNDNQNNPGTRLEPMSNKESPEVEITVEVQLVYTIEEEEESA
ncbi:hypothetical protein Tco_1220717 [Tanacetum coccineum]